MQTGAPQPTFIVGREHEQALLSSRLAEALTGRGALVLLTGPAGIGKTTLVQALGAVAVEQGCAFLAGACFDIGTPPLYGPWRELTDSAARHGLLPDTLPLLQDDTWIADAPSAEAFVANLQTLLHMLTERGPVVLALEDLHWADPESLEFLRGFVRRVSELPLLLIATYRADELTPNHALYQLLPHMIRESNAHRIYLPALGTPAIHALVAARYELPDADVTELTTHLATRSDGIPFYLQELLRTFEEEQRLRRTADGWTLDTLDHASVPMLVKQVIDGRLAQFGPEVRRLLELAAVIGPEVPLTLWQRVGHVSDERFTEAIERAVAAHVLEEAPPGLSMRFTHALVREALYAGIPLSRRQPWHRQVAEALADTVGSEPGVVAYHYRQALDPHAVEWCIRAGSRVERVAWLTAADYFAMALDMLGADADPGVRGWLLMRRAKLLRGAQPHTSLTILDAAEAMAVDAQDALLQAYVMVYRGEIRCGVGEVRTGLADLEASVTELARLTPADLERLDELERRRAVLSRSEVDGLLACTLALVGRIGEALDRADAVIGHANSIPMVAWWGRALALALAGRDSEASAAFATCFDEMLRVSADAAIAIMLLQQLSLAQIPYGADDLAERRRIAAQGEAAWRLSSGAHQDVPPRIAWLPLLLIEGDWRAARELAMSSIKSSDATSEKHLASTVVLAQLSRTQGDASLAWEHVYAVLPGGPQTIPGYVDLAPSLTLMRVAVALCLDRDDLATAHAWLEAHDRWLAWSGAVLGQADGQCAWASYALAAGDFQRGRHHAQQALAAASDPRQPLALLTARRLLGVVEVHAGRIAEARHHLEAALLLADACAAPFERALTLLALAELQLRAGTPDAANRTLDEALAICTPLGAQPTLTRAAALAARIAAQAAAASRAAPAGLSPRELEVLRLLATGRSNREIAEALFVSARTVERHITNLYTKIDAHSRSEAIAFAHEHGLI